MGVGRFSKLDVILPEKAELSPRASSINLRVSERDFCWRRLCSHLLRAANTKVAKRDVRREEVGR